MSTLFKFLLFSLMLAMAIALFRGLYTLIKDKSDSKRTLNSLKWRVAFAILIVATIITGIYTGDINPHGLPQVIEEESHTTEND